MPTIKLAAVSGRCLSFTERDEIALFRAKAWGVQAIPRQLGRSPSKISWELRRNAATRSGDLEYRATTAQWHADRRARRAKPAKLASNEALRTRVGERLAGQVCTPDSRLIAGPRVQPWTDRRHGRRTDRRWANAWSPEQIARRLPIEFPNEESMHLSDEAIYQTLYVQGRGALRRELVACLRTGRALRVPRARASRRGREFIQPQLLISEKPAEVEDRTVPGHWEGDLIIRLKRSAIGTLVEQSTRFTMLLHLPRLVGYGTKPRVKNGPALTGQRAKAARDAIATAIQKVPEQLRYSFPWDKGAEMAHHQELRLETGLQVYFCDPHSPWQRGTNENTNGLLRQYFPKGTDPSRFAAKGLSAGTTTLNAPPRKTLTWRTPGEALQDHL